MRILYATDGSSQARAAGVLLAGLNLSPKDHITVFTVDDRSGEIAYDKIFKAASEDLSGTAAAIDTGNEEGFADEGIIKACRESAVDLLVLGAKGRFPGRDARRVLRHAPCSVLVSRQKKTAIRNVLFAFDGTLPSITAAERLLNFPLAPETRIHLVTILAPLEPGRVRQEPVHLRNGLEELKVLQDLSRIKRDFLAAGRLAKVHTMRGAPATCLLDYAQSEDIDLIVLGFYNTSLPERILRFFLRSVSEKVARYASASILLVRPRQ